jgi:hypothetical protein
VQGLLARRRGALAKPKQSEALIKERCGLRETVGLDSSSCQFDRECDAVELPADGRHDRGVRVAEIQMSAARRCAFDE